MKATKKGNKYIFSEDEEDRMCSQGDKNTKLRGKSLLKVMRAINKIEKKLDLNITDFSEFLDKDATP